MFGSTLNDYIRSRKIADMNNKLVNREYDIAIENKKLMQGLMPSPIPVEEPKPFEDREKVMAFLRTITYEPNRFFTYLFDKGEVAIFAQRMHDFNKETYGRTNMSAKELENLWQKYITLTIDRDLKLKGIPPEEIIAYDYEVNPVKALQAKERTEIRRQGLSVIPKNIKELEQVEKQMKDLARRIVIANYKGEIEESNKLNDAFMKLDKKKKTLVKKVELETAKEPFNPIEQMREKPKSSVQLIQNVVRSKQSEEYAAEKQSQLQKSLTAELNKRKKRSELVTKLSELESLPPLDARTKEGKERKDQIEKLRIRISQLS